MLKRYVRVKKSRPRRKGPYRSPRYRRYVAQQPCLVTGRTPCDCCHGPVNGLSSKGPDSECFPLTHELHMELHRIGRDAFQHKYNLDLAYEAVRMFQQWAWRIK